MEVGYINGMNLGVGFNTASYDIHPTPALDDVSMLRPIVGAGGQEVYFNVQLASSTLSLTEQLNVSARASLKYGISASGSAKTSFVNSFKQNSFSVYVLVQTIVTNKQTLLDLSKIRLESQAANLFVNNPQAFIQQYGDAFVYGLITGGEFIGVLEIESSNSAEFREIKASLSGKASWGLYSGNGKATFEQSMQKITSSYQMKATVIRLGGGGGLNVVTPEQLVKDALEFPSTVANDEGLPYTALIIPYNHIPHPVASPLDVSHQMFVLEQLGVYRQRLIKYQNDLTYARDHQEQFPGIDIQRVNERYNQISSEISNIVSSASACYTDRSKCKVPELNFSLLDNILPPQIEEKLDIGTTWIEKESGWDGVWKRRGNSNIFDAHWTKAGENDVTAVMTVHRIGNGVIVERRNSSDGNDCDIVGIMDKNGKMVAGNYTCNQGGGSWQATIH